jgi:hypothetical protein
VAITLGCVAITAAMTPVIPAYHSIRVISNAWLAMALLSDFISLCLFAYLLETTKRVQSGSFPGIWFGSLIILDLLLAAAIVGLIVAIEQMR